MTKVLFLAVLSFFSLNSPLHADSPSAQEEVCLLKGAKSTPPEIISSIVSGTSTELQSTAKSLSMPIDQFIGRFADEYTKSLYSPEEIANVLKDLIKLTKKSTFSPAVDARLLAGEGTDFGCGEPKAGSDSDRIFLFVDPTCSYCHEVTELLLGLQKQCPRLIPAVVIRLIPSSTSLSQEVATFLESVRLSKPELYCAVLLDIMSSSHHGNEKDNLISLKHDYKKLLDAEPRKQVQFINSSVPPPFAQYRGIVIRRVGTFNPFASFTELLYTILTIQANVPPGESN